MIRSMTHSVTQSVTLCAALVAASCFSFAPAAKRETTPLVLAHRGASGYLPEHTLEAYTLAFAQGADFVEPDVVMTRDNALVCSHDIHIQNTAAMAKAFPHRKRADGKWYFIDFDLAELKSLNAATGRGGDGLPGLQLATFDEMLALIKRLNEALKPERRVGVIPEPKNPAFHTKAGRDLVAAVVKTLAEHGYKTRQDPAILQCFDLDALRAARKTLGCDLRMVYLFGDQPMSAVTLDELATWADGVGPARTLLEKDDGSPGLQPDLIALAAARKLGVYVYTFRTNAAEIRAYLGRHPVAGFFTDYPDRGVEAVKR